MAETMDLTGDGGVLKTVIRKAKDDATAPSESLPLVDVHYEGTLAENGEVFDTTHEDNSIFSFEVGQGAVIKAWDIALRTMKVGEVAKITCKPEYAYGSAGSPPEIPPNSTLIFEVELVACRPRKGSSLGSVSAPAYPYSHPYPNPYFAPPNPCAYASSHETYPPPQQSHEKLGGAPVPPQQWHGYPQVGRGGYPSSQGVYASPQQYYGHPQLSAGGYAFSQGAYAPPHQLHGYPQTGVSGYNSGYPIQGYPGSCAPNQGGYWSGHGHGEAHMDKVLQAGCAATGDAHMEKGSQVGTAAPAAAGGAHTNKGSQAGGAAAAAASSGAQMHTGSQVGGAAAAAAAWSGPPCSATQKSEA